MHSPPLLQWSSLGTTSPSLQSPWLDLKLKNTINQGFNLDMGNSPLEKSYSSSPTSAISSSAFLIASTCISKAATPLSSSRKVLTSCSLDNLARAALLFPLLPVLSCRAKCGFWELATVCLTQRQLDSLSDLDSLAPHLHFFIIVACQVFFWSLMKLKFSSSGIIKMQTNEHQDISKNIGLEKWIQSLYNYESQRWCTMNRLHNVKFT